MCVFGFTLIWIVRIVRIGCKSFLFSTQTGGGALGDLSFVAEIMILIEGRDKLCLIGSQVTLFMPEELQ